MRFGIALMVMLATTRLVAQDAEKVATPSDAVGWALADLATLPADTRPFVRYVWIPPWGFPSWHGAMSFAVNTACNRSSTIQQPVILANGWLMRWDFRELADNEFQLKELIEAWDSMAADEPYFHIPEANKKTGANVAIVAPHIATEHAKLVEQLNASPALVYRADWLAARMLTTIGGGKYYELRGIKPSKDKNRTDQDVFLATFGAFESLSQKLNADERVAMKQSKVTGKPRRVDGFRGLGGKASTGQIWITHDMSSDKLNVENDPLYNLLTFEDAAREIIIESNNGLHIFGLFDAKGKLQRFVPPDVVTTDTTVPPPFDSRLNGAISCIRCHGKDSGLKDAPNDVARTLAGELDAFDDLSSNSDRYATVKRLASLYAGDFTKRIRLGRDDYEDAVFRASGGMPVSEASESVGLIVENLNYRMVTLEQALLEVGYRVKPKDAKAFVKSRIAEYQETGGIKQESYTIGELREGGEVQRFAFEREYADFATRMKETTK